MQDASTNFLATGFGTGIGIALLVAGLVALLAPFMFAIAARDMIATLTATALLVAAIGVMVTGKTVIHEVLAAVLYLAALLSSATIYAGSRIEKALQR